MLSPSLTCLHNAPVRADPFAHIFAEGFLGADALARINAEFPPIRDAGSFPVHIADASPALREVIAEIESDTFRTLMEDKFALSLEDRPLTMTLRGHCAARDGRPHTDSTTKALTILLYLNLGAWQPSGGRLRLLRSKNVADAACELPPDGGSILIFPRTDTSWHGHEPYTGPRRSLQANYMTSAKAQSRLKRLHAVSSWFKRRA